MRTTLFTFLIIASCTSLASAQDFDLPEVIFFHIGQPRNASFASEFCWVGDQNGDGYDDLLVSHRALNRVELFHGGENMDNDPDFFFTIEGDYMFVGNQLDFPGELLPDRAPFIYVNSYYDNRNRPPAINYHRLFESEEELDNEPEHFFTGGYESVPFSAHRRQPFDFNGDDHSDLVMRNRIDGIETLFVYYGGADFDTIPDWEAETAGIYPGAHASTGFDINSDGYNDLFVKVASGFDSYTFQLFLGGEEPSAEPIFSIPWHHFEGLILKYGFALLPDINGDGYDDWGLHFNNDIRTWDGYYIFYGGEEPDMEPDILLDGNAPGTGDRRGEICGGDFNNDGYGDIVTADPSAGYGDAQLNYFFGRPELPEEMEADILINMREDYEEHRATIGLIGAVGDYNGDEIDDFAASAGPTYRMIILAGSNQWQVNEVDEELPTNYNLALTAYPNPFNSTTHLSFNLQTDSEITITVLDIQGRTILRITDLNLKAGRQTIPLNFSSVSGGIYFAQITLSGINRSRSETVKLVNLK